MKPVAHILKSKTDQSVYTITPTARVFDALKLMAEKDIGALVVMDGEKIVGIITERDYARKVVLMARSSKETPVRDIPQAARGWQLPLIDGLGAGLHHPSFPTRRSSRADAAIPSFGLPAVARPGGLRAINATQWSGSALRPRSTRSATGTRYRRRLCQVAAGSGEMGDEQPSLALPWIPVSA
jgi:FOG: CBS domain